MRIALTCLLLTMTACNDYEMAAPVDAVMATDAGNPITQGDDQ